MQIRMRYIVVAIAIVLCAVMCAYVLISREGDETSVETAVVIRDTVVLHNTETKTVVRYVSHTDTAVFVCRDTVRDTVFITLPIAHKRYCDTLRGDSAEVRFAVDYHGWRAGIDSVRVSYEMHPRIVIQEKRRGFGQFVGVGVGVGAGIGMYGVQPIACPYVGVSVVYGFGYRF